MSFSHTNFSSFLILFIFQNSLLALLTIITQNSERLSLYKLSTPSATNVTHNPANDNTVETSPNRRTPKSITTIGSQEHRMDAFPASI